MVVVTHRVSRSLQMIPGQSLAPPRSVAIQCRE